MSSLRDYQRDLVERVISSRARRTLVVLPTGGGKTVCMTALAQRHEGRTVVLCDRQELIDQALAHMGPGAGVMIGAHRREGDPMVVGVFTAVRRKPVGADLVLVDEAHLAAARTWKAVLDFYPGARIVGWTATPYRHGGGSLGELFDDVVSGPSIAELIAAGWLSPVRTFAVRGDVTKACRVRAGEFVAEDLGLAMGGRVLKDAVATWRRITGGQRRTLVFACNVQHAHDLAEEIGAGAEVITGETPAEQRRGARERLAGGEVIALVSVNVLGIGFDCPAAEVALGCRPTMSRGVFRQQNGRVMRTSPGKVEALILDCAGNVGRHGLPTWPDVTDLAGRVVPIPKRGRVLGLHNCPKCLCVYETGSACPECGAAVPVQKRVVRTVRGTLDEVIGIEATQAQSWQATASHEARIGWARKKLREGWSRARVTAAYRAMFKSWPPQEVFR